MKEDQKPNRIFRLHLQNIAPTNYYKPVTQRNNVFCRVKRNSCVLSKIDNSEDKNDIGNSQSCDFNGQQRVQSTKINFQQKEQGTHLSIRSVSMKRSQRSLESYECNKKTKNYRHAKQLLPQIRKSLQINFSPTPTNKGNNKAFDDSKNSSQNEIQGTRIGVLSSKEILKKYETKKLNEELSKRQFLDEHIKNLKNSDYEVDDDGEDEEDANNRVKKNQSSILRNVIKFNRAQSVASKSIGLSESRHKLVDLLQNRLTDRDYIDFNVKLFEKRDINKKRYFQRYHNILKQQRNEIGPTVN